GAAVRMTTHVPLPRWRPPGSGAALRRDDAGRGRPAGSRRPRPTQRSGYRKRRCSGPASLEVLIRQLQGRTSTASGRITPAPAPGVLPRCSARTGPSLPADAPALDAPGGPGMAHDLGAGATSGPRPLDRDPGGQLTATPAATRPRPPRPLDRDPAGHLAATPGGHLTATPGGHLAATPGGHLATTPGGYLATTPRPSGHESAPAGGRRASSPPAADPASVRLRAPAGRSQRPIARGGPGTWSEPGAILRFRAARPPRRRFLTGGADSRRGGTP
ncbi:MAG: hypothetical protein QOK40_2187, partial [Miltoncostaeaceae bacterium]|nr:hypothetical protein [Miltoncostaeaceae bacterium]